MRGVRKAVICVLVAMMLVIPLSLAREGYVVQGDSATRKNGFLAMDNVTIEGNYSGFYDFPERFFEESDIPKEEVVKVTDAQYLALRQMHNGIHPYGFCIIEYDPDVYGCTTPHGFKLGDYAFPSYHNGHHCWHVMGHEQGHNFFGGTSWFYYTMAAPYPFLQESLAVLSTMYTYHIMLEKQDEYGLSQEVVESLDYIYLEEERELQQNMYEKYVRQGCPFDLEDVLTSQALDYKMILYGEQYGWHNYEQVAKAFENSLRWKFNFISDGANATEQATYIVTALNVAFDRDFRPDFRELNFPIDDTLYEEWHSILQNYVTDTTPPEVSIEKPMENELYIFNQEMGNVGATLVFGDIDVEVSAADSKSGVKKVEIYVDEELKETCIEEPYVWQWTERGIGWHTLKTVAYDNENNTASVERQVWMLNL